MGDAMSEIVDVMGWQLTVFDDDSDPLIRDIDLAVRLGYERPRDIRQLIERLIRAGNLKDIRMRGAVQRIDLGQNRFRDDEVEEYWLTQKQALKVIMRSDAAMADAIQDEIIDVYVAYRQGLLRPALIALQLRLTPDLSNASIWGDWFVDLVRKLYGKPSWDRNSPFPGLGRHLQEIYRTVLGDEVYQELRARNPDPQGDSLHYHYLTEAMHKRMTTQDMAIVEAFLGESRNWKDFMARLRHKHERAPLQLGW